MCTVGCTIPPSERGEALRIPRTSVNAVSIALVFILFEECECDKPDSLSHPTSSRASPNRHSSHVCLAPTRGGCTRAPPYERFQGRIQRDVGRQSSRERLTPTTASRRVQLASAWAVRKLTEGCTDVAQARYGTKRHTRSDILLRAGTACGMSGAGQQKAGTGLPAMNVREFPVFRPC